MSGSESPSQQDPTALDRSARGFDRFFPGPANRDPKTSERLDAIRKAMERRATAEQQHRARRQDAVPAVTADVDRLVDAVHEQTDVLRALLDADIAIRDDARATAQNSRTFAIAGTAIAFLTFVATVVTVVVAVKGG